MTDDEKLKLAREKEFLRQAIAVNIEIALNKAGVLLVGEQGEIAADAALTTINECAHPSAINALTPQLDEADGLLRACVDGGHSYESEGQLHDAVRAFLAKQGEG